MDGRLSTWKLQQETKSPGESVNEQRAEGRMCEPFTCKAGMQEREIDHERYYDKFQITGTGVNTFSDNNAI